MLPADATNFKHVLGSAGPRAIARALPAMERELGLHRKTELAGALRGHLQSLRASQEVQAALVRDVTTFRRLHRHRT